MANIAIFFSFISSFLVWFSLFFFFFLIDWRVCDTSIEYESLSAQVFRDRQCSPYDIPPVMLADSSYFVAEKIYASTLLFNFSVAIQPGTEVNVTSDIDTSILSARKVASRVVGPGGQLFDTIEIWLNLNLSSLIDASDSVQFTMTAADNRTACYKSLLDGSVRGPCSTVRVVTLQVLRLVCPGSRTYVLNNGSNSISIGEPLQPHRNRFLTQLGSGEIVASTADTSTFKAGVNPVSLTVFPHIFFVGDFEW